MRTPEPEAHVPISLELLNTTFQNYKGPLVVAFQQSHICRSELERMSKVQKGTGSYIERPIAIGGVGNATGLYEGSELIVRGRRKVVKKYRVDYHRIAVQAEVPRKELDQNTGKEAVVRIIETYPVVTMEQYSQDRESYFFTGAVSATNPVATADELAGFSTLNGQSTGGRGTGVENGLIDFQAPSAQTDTVQNYAKNEEQGHFNQYGHITSFASNGMTTFRRVYRACANRSADPRKGPGFMAMDDETFTNFESYKENLVRLKVVSDSIDGKGDPMVETFKNAKVHSSPFIDLTAFTGAAALGVTYILDLNEIEIHQIQKADWSPWVRGGQRQDTVYTEFIEHEAMIFRRMACHGAITGGATP